MKVFIYCSLAAYLALLSNSCRNAETGTLNYSALHYDTNRVAIFRWDTTKYVFPNNSDPLPLTQRDLFITDSLLQNAIDSFNAINTPRLYLSFNKVVPIDSLKIDPARYKLQFFPYKDVNGQRIVSILGFKEDFANWKTDFYVSPIDDYGLRGFQLKVNLSDKTRENVQTGGFG